MYVDVLESIVGAEMWRNIPYDENVMNSHVGGTLENIIKIMNITHE